MAVGAILAGVSAVSSIAGGILALRKLLGKIEPIGELIKNKRKLLKNRLKGLINTMLRSLQLIKKTTLTIVNTSGKLA